MDAAHAGICHSPVSTLAHQHNLQQGKRTRFYYLLYKSVQLIHNACFQVKIAHGFLQKCPVLVAAGRHEWWCGQGKDTPHILLLLLTSVVTSSIIINSSYSGFKHSVKGHLTRKISKCLLSINRLNNVK